MEHLTEIALAVVGDLPPYVRTIIGLMVALLIMARVALGVVQRFRKDRLPWGASSDRLLAAMIWLVCVPVIVVALLFLLYVGSAVWEEVADAFAQAAY